MQKVNSLSLQDRFSAFKAEEDPGVFSNEASGPTDADPCKTTRRKRQVIVAGDSLLQGAEETICQSDLLSKEFCCLWVPGFRMLWMDY